MIVRRDKIPDVSLAQRMLALPNRCPSAFLPWIRMMLATPFLILWKDFCGNMQTRAQSPQI
ncbi:MAG: hypothetical protein L6Q26_12735, partial [Anaerolineales bacterium]|nr:hypothetical protein [Anaerolineales bacterium]